LVIDGGGGYEFGSLYNAKAHTRRYNLSKMDFLKTITGKVITGFIALAVIAGGISWWSMDPATRQLLISGTGKILAWLGVVLFLPWVSFVLIGKIAKMESNAAGAALVAGYTIAETILLLWLFNWQVPGATAWTFLVVGGLFAAAYNLFACDWIAEKVT
jgi:hypothetical protein